MIKLSNLTREAGNMARYDKLPLLKEGDTTDSETSVCYGTTENIQDNQTSDGNVAQTQHIPDEELPLPKPARFVYLLTFLATIGGFLFGYDTGVVSGALILLRDEFQLTTFWQELFVSITIAFAAIFSFLSGPFNECFGRRPVIIAASVVFTLGAVVLALAVNKQMLLIGRAVLGTGIGDC